MRPKTISHSGPRTIYELRDRFRPSHRVLRVTATGIATEPACREMYASLSHFAETGGPYAALFDMTELQTINYPSKPSRMWQKASRSPGRQTACAGRVEARRLWPGSHVRDMERWHGWTIA